MPTNAELLTRGATVYANKRKAKKERLEEVVFDPENRREFLTGFHKRKVERHTARVEKAKERDKKERIENRRTHREDIANAAKAKVAAYHEFVKRNRPEVETEEKLTLDCSEDSGEDSSEDETAETAEREEAKTSEFRTAETLTTVTVIEDMNGEDEEAGRIGGRSLDGDEDAETKARKPESKGDVTRSPDEKKSTNVPAVRDGGVKKREQGRGRGRGRGKSSRESNGRKGASSRGGSGAKRGTRGGRGGRGGSKR